MGYYNIPNSKKFFYYERRRKASSPGYEPFMYVHMFTEDIRLGIMPIGGRSENPEFAIKLVPYDPITEERIIQGFNHSSYFRSHLVETICDFIERVALNLAYSGKVVYEIVYFYDDEKMNNIVGFTLDQLDINCIRNFGGFYWQLLPKKKIGDRNYTRFNYARRKDLIIFTFPKSLGGRLKLRKMIKVFKMLSKNSFPKFVFEDMAGVQPPSGFELKIYKERQENLVASITRDIGWNARRLFSERSLESYEIYRYLKFEKTKAILRDYILSELNNALVKIGEKMHFNASIIIEGLPSPKEYDNWISQLVEGTISFSDAIGKTRF